MITRVITKDRRRLIALVYVAVLLLLCVVFFYPSEQGSPTLRLVGLTNFPGQAQLTALFSITNHSAEALDIAHLAEVKTADWPDPERLTTWLVLPAVGPHQVSTIAVDVPDSGSAWRLRVAYSGNFTMWDRTRSALASSLHARNFQAAAKWLSPRVRIREIKTAEMKITQSDQTKSLQPTPAGVGCSAHADHVVGPAWLGLGR